MLYTGDILLIVTNSALHNGDKLDETIGDLLLVTKRPLLYQMIVFGMLSSSPFLTSFSEMDCLFLIKNLNAACLNPGYLDS